MLSKIDQEIFKLGDLAVRLVKPASTHVHGRPSGVHECIASDVWKCERCSLILWDTTTTVRF